MSKVSYAFIFGLIVGILVVHSLLYLDKIGLIIAIVLPPLGIRISNILDRIED